MKPVIKGFNEISAKSVRGDGIVHNLTKMPHDKDKTYALKSVCEDTDIEVANDGSTTG